MSKERCPYCKVEYKGHRKGDYNPNLKSIYERSGASGVFVKVGYRCPECHRFFGLDLSKKGWYKKKKENWKQKKYDEAGDLSEISYDLR